MPPLPNMDPDVVGVLDDVAVELAMSHVEPMIGAAGVHAAVAYSNPTQHFSFESRLQQLHHFKEAHGHCNVPMDYSLDPGYVFIFLLTNVLRWNNLS